jgi:alpha-tubulin suppressor-like RCC1 family protein
VFSIYLVFVDSLCLNSEGELFAWGKGERGQLGQEAIQNSIHCAVPITKAIILRGENNKPIYHELGKINQIGAGMIHSAALDDNNNVYVWGKNLLPKVDGQENLDKTALDAKLPLQLTGLPANLKVEQIACGSHHTSVLFNTRWCCYTSSSAFCCTHGPYIDRWSGWSTSIPS